MDAKNIKFGKDFNPEGMVQFARVSWGVSDPEKLQSIVNIYHHWFYNRDRVSFHINPEPAEGKVDTCLMIRIGGTEKEPKHAYISHRKDIQYFVWREQAVKADMDLASMSVIDRATLMHGNNFGHRYSDTGRYMGGMHFYDDLAHKRIRVIAQGAVYSSYEKLIDQFESIIEDDDQKGRLNRYEEGNPLLKHVEMVERSAVRLGVRQMLATLDQDALKIIARARLPDSHIYGWLMGYRESYWDYDACEDIEPKPVPSSSYRNRQAAGWAYPSLLAAFAYRGGLEITRHLDAGMSVPLAIIEGIKKRGDWEEGDNKPVTQEVLKWLQGKRVTYFDNPEDANPNAYHVHTELIMLSAIPREWRPRNQVEFNAYEKLESNIGGFAPYLNKPKYILMREFLAALNNPGGIPRFLMEEKTSDGNTITTLKPIFEIVTPVQAMVSRHADYNSGKFKINGNLKDALDNIENQIVLPEIVRQMEMSGLSSECVISERGSNSLERISNGLMKHIFGNFTVMKMLSFNHRWHKHTERLQRRTGRINRDTEWHPLVSPTMAPNGVMIRAMSSSREIMEMGKLMGNCIGGYTYQCSYGRSHVLVLEGKAKSFMTNLELTEYGEPHKRKVGIEQHSLEGNNSNIPKQAKVAADWLVGQINNGSINPDWKAVDATREEVRKDALLIKIGFDPLNTEFCDNAYEVWHGTMRDILPYATRDEFLDRSGMRAAIAAKIQAEFPKIRPQRRLAM